MGVLNATLYKGGITMVFIGTTTEGYENVNLDFDKSRRVLITGKTGSGKSYTLGVFIEEIFGMENNTLLVIDPQGVFWTMAQPNFSQEDKLYNLGKQPKGYPVNVLVPGEPKERYGRSDVLEALKDRGVKISSLRINPSDLTEEMWCDLFGLSINELSGITLFKAVRNCRKKLNRDFLIEDIIDEVTKLKALDVTKEAVIRKLEMAIDWDIFERLQYKEFWDVLYPTMINIIDLSVIDQGRYGLRNLIVAVLGKVIFNQRTIARRAEALGLQNTMPKVWMAIDEAHNFCPAGKSSLSKEILIRWAKEGRQPGLSLVVASQQPGAIDSEILTQCDLKIVHKVTSREDRKAIDSLSEDYMDRDILTYIRNMKHVGEALIIDDKKERAELVSIRVRYSDHGGDSA